LAANTKKAHDELHAANAKVQSSITGKLFGGKPAPPAPVGLLMRGTYVGADGFRIEFDPGSAVV
jgi:hypothetical protein